MKIAVVGTGYVGLVTGTCFAETGNHVVCVHIDASKVARMQRGEIPIYEPHLDVLFERNIKQGRLSFTTDLSEGIRDAQIIFLALPTPPGEDGSADLKYVLQVAGQLGGLMRDYKIIVNKSTVPVGTAEKVRTAIVEQVITVVGCGGDSDRTKRPVMAEAACEHSDKAIFTSDNPRTEEPGQIIKDMEEGLAAAYKRKYISIVDRKEAIKTAISLAKSEDIILIAGKGHEKYQEIKGVRNHFDDKEVVKEFFELLDK